MRLLLVCLALLFLLAPLAHAQSDIVQGGMELNVIVGYGEFGLPIANSAVGRKWAEGSEMYWQVANNYSTVPVRIDIEHRLANAFAGRIEVTSDVPFAPEEFDGKARELLSQRILVPPSVLKSYMFAPRVCPDSEPGLPVELHVRIYKDGITQPIFDRVASVYQLEPAHLYSLRLDGPLDPSGWPTLARDRINPDNHLKLAFTSGSHIPDSIYSSDHWIISVDHRQLTGLPTAARDFAFVFADAREVGDWPEEDQQGLLQYLLAGGYACLYGSKGVNWRNLQGSAVMPLGRGVLVNVDGEFESAVDTTRRWMEGELEELALWLGGSCDGTDLEEFRILGGKITRFPIIGQFSLEDNVAEILSHRPGFLHPVWIYREACRKSSIEPWDSAEYLLFEESGWRGNKYLNIAASQLDDPEFTSLIRCAQPARHLPPLYWVCSLAAVCLAAMALGLKGRPLAATGAAAAVLLAGGLLVCFRLQPPDPGTVSIELLDMDINATGAACRSVIATEAGSDGKLGFDLPPAAVLRHLAWSNHGNWELTASDARTSWEAVSPESRIAVTADSVHAGGVTLPVQIEVSSTESGRTRITVDTSGLAAGQRAYLYTVFGWVVLEGGSGPVAVELPHSRFAQMPGAQRLRYWSEQLQRWSYLYAEDPLNLDSQTIGLLSSLQHSRRDTQSGKPQLTAATALNGLLQSPEGLRGSLTSQGLLITPVELDSEWAQAEQHIAFARITFPIGKTQ